MVEDIRAVFFDLDDTCIATKDAKWAHHKYVAKTFYGIELSDEDIIPHWGKPFPELVCLLYKTDNAEEALKNNTSCRDSFPKTLYDGTIPTLRRLRMQRRLTGIVTATIRSSFNHDLEFLNIPRELIDYSQTADDTKFHKPDPRVFEPAIAWLRERQISPNEVTYVGDGLHDMRAALGVGFNFIGVETGLVTSSQFLEHGAKSIPNIASLIDHI